MLNATFYAGIFPKFSGVEFENFTIIAEKLRSDYDFSHTLDAKLVPGGESPYTGPIIRLMRPFDERFFDFQNFHLDAMEKIIEEANSPLVTIFDHDPNNRLFIFKFLDNPNSKATLFLNFSNERSDDFKSIYYDIAFDYKGEGVSFSLGDVELNRPAFKHFGLKYDQVPLIIIQSNNGLKYTKSNLEPNQIGPWLKEYMNGNLMPFIKSAPIPEANNERVKVVVADSLQDMVLDSRKNVLLQIYVIGCSSFNILDPVLDEVAVSFENADVMIATLDGTANDIPPNDIFDVKNCYTVYFKSASGVLLRYDGDGKKEEIIEFIQKNRDENSQSNSAELVKDE